ncbi:UV excision repair protein RAD23 [Babesia microti strain RI]|uniref:UV excision repair protein RAD23 n=1 Tax=Babesia microti (strain RI) TaxID=1133968 RepID=A0A1R4AC92_BABMR|nr:UV excision repair protein RAD23 [Babesia microti strain RI]SJK86639.1 UV excision repair protein RAD23 [Babesia microti strain RI]|eukprot:XP_021338772.1 UV excision repair protein RAD23 [Babesia microti strain RI]
MKLIACTLKNVETCVEVDPSDTVDALTNKIGSSLNNASASKMRLIHAGKILKMEQKISDYSDIKDGDKIIVLFSKQSEASTIANPTPAPTSTPIADANTSPPKPIPTTDPNALLMGEELEKAINGIVEMGFDVESVKAAMSAAFNNPNRAIELLTRHEVDVSDHDTHQSVQTTGVLDELRQHPMFEQMRAIVRSNPQTLPQILSLIGQSDPSLLQAITENQEEFIQLLSEPVLGTSGDFIDAQSITLTPEEMESINRLEGLGFSRPAAVEAFLACDKNEEMAANYLLENIADYVSDNDN